MRNILVFLAFFWISISSAEESAKVVKMVTGDGQHEWQATAFYISPTELLTAAHTFRNHTSIHLIVKDGRTIPCTIKKIDFERDICLLECSEKSEAFYPLLRHGKVTAVGYEDQHRAQTESPGQTASQFKINLRCVPGMSGCPLVDEGGYVIGMGVKHGAFGKKETECTAISSDALAMFLEGK